MPWRAPQNAALRESAKLRHLGEEGTTPFLAVLTSCSRQQPIFRHNVPEARITINAIATGKKAEASTSKTERVIPALP
jgi:hypothetical protein